MRAEKETKLSARTNRWLVALAIASGLLLPARGQAARVVLPRPGDLGFAGFAQYGTLLKQGEIGDKFGTGPGFGIRMRYRMRYERGLGLTFERQGFDVREKSTADTAAVNTTMILTGFELYQMFGTRTRTTKMLSVGVGLGQITQKLNDGETQSAGTGVGDGFYVSLGGGTETFVWQSWAIDLSLRYHAVILHDTTNHDFQIGIGLVFYAAD